VLMPAQILRENHTREFLVMPRFHGRTERLQLLKSGWAE
jgi:hypothetical protein